MLFLGIKVALAQANRLHNFVRDALEPTHPVLYHRPAAYTCQLVKVPDSEDAPTPLVNSIIKMFDPCRTEVGCYDLTFRSFSLIGKPHKFLHIGAEDDLGKVNHMELVSFIRATLGRRWDLPEDTKDLEPQILLGQPRIQSDHSQWKTAPIPLLPEPFILQVTGFSLINAEKPMSGHHSVYSFNLPKAVTVSSAA